MPHRSLLIEELVVNRANDRHGELENETAAIAWLFNEGESHMRNLAKDIAKTGQVFEAPLVFPEKGKFVVFDGNRRVTCLKLIQTPKRAPTTELRVYFEELKHGSDGRLPTRLDCQIETDRDQIDQILFRRHTGTQNGVGRSNWDDRMKANFISRTGMGNGFNVADEVEKRLAETPYPPIKKKIPWSTLNRLLSSEPYRNRVGFSFSKRQFEFTHQSPVVMKALHRIANDLANQTITLNDVWDVDGKRAYLDALDAEGVLPTVEHTLTRQPAAAQTRSSPTKFIRPATPQQRTTLIPNVDFGLLWPGRLQRHHAIWEELQFRLRLTEHPNAISVLFRVLLELSIENYIAQTSLRTTNVNDKLAKKALRVAEHLFENGKISKRDLELLKKFPQYDTLVSADTLNRYVHSGNFAPSPEHLTALWDTLASFIVQCLKS